MRNKGWLRYSLASLTLMGAGLGAFLVACGDDDNVTPGRDSGVDTGTGEDSGAQDAGQDQQSPVDSGSPARLQLVNAATNFGGTNASGALRVCYGLGDQGTIAPLPPLPDRKSSDAQPFPGVYIGTGGPVQGTGVDLSATAITPYIMNAQKLAERGVVRPDAGGVGPDCAALINGEVDAGGAFVEGVDYWKLPTIPAGTLLKEKSYILILTGCSADTTVPAQQIAKCGPDFTDAGANGNLRVTVHEVDRATAIDADKIGTQFIHASAPGAAAFAVGSIPVIPGYIKDKNDPDTFKGITAGDGGAGGSAAVTLGQKTPLVQVQGVDVATDSFIANPSAANTAFTLQQIQQMSYGANVPANGAYANGKAFTFIAVGDPAEPATVNGQFNTKVFHFIALPNDAVNEVFKP